MDTTVIVPTFNEGGNVGPLLARLEAAFASARGRVEVLFVDDSVDNTPDIIRGEAARLASQCIPSPITVRLHHRAEPTGGLAGAVVEGIRRAAGEHIIVMDGDLQHPPEVAPLLRTALVSADLVVASRYCRQRGAGADGLDGGLRRLVSSGSTAFARACFPRRVAAKCTDPMTGFFAFRRAAVDVDRLRPRGFKILLEILARHDVSVVEVPFVFASRGAGDSKSSLRNGLHFLYQMAALRFGRASRFAAIGVLGTLVNLTVMAGLYHGVFDFNYVVAALVAAEISILHNFVLIERFVFRDLAVGRPWRRAAQFFAFNNAEALVRTGVLVFLVERLGLYPVAVQAVLLGTAFLARFLFTARVIYRPRGGPRTPPVTPAGVRAQRTV